MAGAGVGVATGLLSLKNQQDAKKANRRSAAQAREAAQATKEHILDVAVDNSRRKQRAAWENFARTKMGYERSIQKTEYMQKVLGFNLGQMDQQLGMLDDKRKSLLRDTTTEQQNIAKDGTRKEARLMKNKATVKRLLSRNVFDSTTAERKRQGTMAAKLAAGGQSAFRGTGRLLRASDAITANEERERAAIDAADKMDMIDDDIMNVRHNTSRMINQLLSASENKLDDLDDNEYFTATNQWMMEMEGVNAIREQQFIGELGLWEGINQSRELWDDSRRDLLYGEKEAELAEKGGDYNAKRYEAAAKTNTYNQMGGLLDIGSSIYTGAKTGNWFGV